jgi:DNA mismatch endonuclease (patch repair protein)
MAAYESWASSPASRKVMQGNRSRDTSAELAVRRRLHAAGLRFRVAHRPLPAIRRTADIVFTKQRIAVFIDGCYWHACPEHYVAARSNAAYWSEKLARNVVRDAETTELLRASGWTVLRYWEHEDADEVAAQVVAVVRNRAGPAEDSPR